MLDNPISIGLLTGLLIGLSILFFSIGHPVIGAFVLTAGLLLGFFGLTKFFRGED